MFLRRKGFELTCIELAQFVSRKTLQEIRIWKKLNMTSNVVIDLSLLVRRQFVRHWLFWRLERSFVTQNLRLLYILQKYLLEKYIQVNQTKSCFFKWSTLYKFYAYGILKKIRTLFAIGPLFAIRHACSNYLIEHIKRILKFTGTFAIKLM